MLFALGFLIGLGAILCIPFSRDLILGFFSKPVKIDSKPAPENLIKRPPKEVIQEIEKIIEVEKIIEIPKEVEIEIKPELIKTIDKLIEYYFSYREPGDNEDIQQTIYKLMLRIRQLRDYKDNDLQIKEEKKGARPVPIM